MVGWFVEVGIDCEVGWLAKYPSRLERRKKRDLFRRFGNVKKGGCCLTEEVVPVGELFFSGDGEGGFSLWGFCGRASHMQ